MTTDRDGAASLPGPFGARLRSLRTLRGLTQQQLADAAGVHREAVARWESGRVHAPRLDRIRSLARALGVPLAALAGGNNHEQR